MTKPVVLLFKDERMPVILSDTISEELADALARWHSDPRRPGSVITINPNEVDVILVGEEGGATFAANRDTTSDTTK